MSRAFGTGTLVKRPSGLFMARWVFDGKIYTRSTQTKDRDEALKKLDEFVKPFLEETKIAVLENLQAKIRTIQQTETLLSDIEKEKKRVRLDYAFDAYMTDVNVDDISAGTEENYYRGFSLFERWINREYPNVKYIDELTDEMAKEYFTSISKTVSSATYNRYLVYLRRIFKILLGESNFLSGLKKKKAVSKFPRRALTTAELKKLLNYVEGDQDMKILFHLGIYTGSRISDCSLLKWENVDFERRLIQFIPKKTQRLGKMLAIPIHPKLLSVLKEVHTSESQPDEYISPTNAQMYKSEYLTPKASNVMRYCGIKKDGDERKVSFHCLRHTFCSMCANAGVPLAIVKEILGHNSEKITSLYYHFNLEAGIKAVQMIKF
ncbi:MAG: tyrosine-type recombinase/integrase [Kiritimatiellae bacterium]|nr:tyrosine-type recombinase/integrase [Kiritimatiellia bacterium]